MFAGETPDLCDGKNSLHPVDTITGLVRSCKTTGLMYRRTGRSGGWLMNNQRINQSS